MRTALLASVAALLAASGSASAGVFADTFVESVGTLGFGSGIVTGPSDQGGLFFPETERGGQYITVGFVANGPFTDGAGIDLWVHDDESGLPLDLDESAQIYVSSDNVMFQFAGTMSGGEAQGQIDLAANNLFGQYSYVRIVSIPLGSFDAIDLDSVEVFYAVPGPTAAGLMGLAGLMAARRRR